MTIITKHAIPRRSVLRGLGASVALPLLDGMVPALTALALVALEMAEVAKLDAKYGSERRRALDFIAGSAKPDGSIHRGQLVNYNTACSLMALSLADEPRFSQLIIKARAYIAASQIDLGEKGKLDNFHDGGVGYNS